MGNAIGNSILPARLRSTAADEEEAKPAPGGRRSARIAQRLSKEAVVAEATDVDMEEEATGDDDEEEEEQEEEKAEEKKAEKPQRKKTKKRKAAPAPKRATRSSTSKKRKAAQK